MNIVAGAKQFASHAHRNHVRNDGARTPDVSHVAEVAELVTASAGSNDEIAAAWLHDTVEDTSTTLEDIRKEFGEPIASIVCGVTDLPEWRSLSLPERKLLQPGRVASASDSIKRVKLADQSSNVQIVGTGREFAMEASFADIESARRIAEACKRVSPYLDDIFGQRYRAAVTNLTVLRNSGA